MKNILSSIFKSKSLEKENNIEQNQVEPQQPIQNIILQKDIFKNNKINQILEENFDFIICDLEQQPKDYSFYAKEPFTIFAKRSNGDAFGFIGQIDDIDNCKIGYVSSYANSSGQAGILAKDLKMLLTLIVFYPFWWSLLNYYEDEIDISVKKAETEVISNNPDYLNLQQQLADYFKLKKSDISIKDILTFIYNSDKFVVYSIDNNTPSRNIFKWHKGIVKFLKK